MNSSTSTTKSILIILGILVQTLLSCGKGDSNTLTDSRDGKTYKTVKIGEQIWMAENLNIDLPGSKCYGNNPDNCKIYGRLYDWETAMKACPQGWYLPSNTDWAELVSYVESNNGNSNCISYSNCAGKYLKAKSGWNDDEGKSNNGIDSYGFAALPGGRGLPSGYFDDGAGYWWSASGYNSETSHHMSYNYDYLMPFGHGKDGLFSVRCVKETEAAKALNAAAEAEAEKAAQEAEAEKIAREVAVAEAAKIAEAIEKANGCAVSNAKLLERITDENGRLLRKFVYDKQNRIVKIVSKDYSTVEGEPVVWNADAVTITYETDDKITVETIITKQYARDEGSRSTKNFLRNGNKIIAGTDTSTINNESVNNDGYESVYNDGNLMRETEPNGVNDTEYSYDDKKSPFSNSKTPKWLLPYIGVSTNKNNILRQETSGGEISFSKTYEYQYDSDGFPTKEKEEVYVEGEEQTGIMHYKYCGGAKN